MSDPSKGENPLKKKLTKEQFDASVKFYEADHSLTPEDRDDIANDLQSILFKTSIIGYTGGMLGFLSPTAYYRFVKHRSIPANAIRPWVYKPGLSFLLGLMTLTVVHPPVTKYYFNQFKGQLQDKPEKSRQLNAWNTFDYHQAGLFYVYYRSSAKNPALILEDPRSYTMEKLHQVRYIPTHDEQIRQKHGQLSHWDQLRIQNGFEPSQQPEVDNNTSKQEPDFFNDNDPAQEPNQDKEHQFSFDSDNQNQKSKWDEIRTSK